MSSIDGNADVVIIVVIREKIQPTEMRAGNKSTLIVFTPRMCSFVWRLEPETLSSKWERACGAAPASVSMDRPKIVDAIKGVCARASASTRRDRNGAVMIERALQNPGTAG